MKAAEQDPVEKAKTEIEQAFKNAPNKTDRDRAIETAFENLAKDPANFETRSADVLRQLHALESSAAQIERNVHPENAGVVLLGLASFQGKNPKLTLSPETTESITDNAEKIAQSLVGDGWPEHLKKCGPIGDAFDRQMRMRAALGQSTGVHPEGGGTARRPTPPTMTSSSSRSDASSEDSSRSTRSSLATADSGSDASSEASFSSASSSFAPADSGSHAAVFPSHGTETSSTNMSLMPNVSPTATNLLIQAQRQYLIDKANKKDANIMQILNSLPGAVLTISSDNNGGYTVQSNHPQGHVLEQDQKKIAEFVKNHTTNAAPTEIPTDDDYVAINREAEIQNQIQQDTGSHPNEHVTYNQKTGEVNLTEKGAHSAQDYRDMVDEFYNFHSLNEKSIITLGERGKGTGYFADKLRSGNTNGRRGALEQTLRKGGIAPEFRRKSGIRSPYTTQEKHLVDVIALNRESMAALKKENPNGPQPTASQAMLRTLTTLIMTQHSGQQLKGTGGKPIDLTQCVNALTQTIMRSRTDLTAQFQKDLAKEKIDIESRIEKTVAGPDREKLNTQLNNITRIEGALLQQAQPRKSTWRDTKTIADSLQLKKGDNGAITAHSDITSSVQIERRPRLSRVLSGLSSGFSLLTGTTAEEGDKRGTSQTLQNAQYAQNLWNAQIKILSEKPPTTEQDKKVHDAQVDMALRILTSMAPKTPKNGVRPSDIQNLLQTTMARSGNNNDANMKSLRAAQAAAVSAAEEDAARAAQTEAQRGGPQGTASSNIATDVQSIGSGRGASEDGTIDSSGSARASRGGQDTDDDDNNAKTTSGRSEREEEEHTVNPEGSGAQQPGSNLQPGQLPGQQPGGLEISGASSGTPVGQPRPNDAMTRADLSAAQPSNTGTAKPLPTARV